MRSADKAWPRWCGWVVLAVHCCASVGWAQSADFNALASSAAAEAEAGKSAEAIRDYTRALEIQPDWKEGLWALGTLHYEANEYQQALPALQKLVQLAPDAGPAWSVLGLCQFELKDYAGALSSLEKAQAFGSGDDPEVSRVASYHLALLLIRNSEFERATSTLLAAFGAGEIPAQGKTALGLAMLRVPLLPEQVDPSRDALIQAAGAVAASGPRGIDQFPLLLKDYPGVPYLHYAYGLALAKAARDEEALVQQKAEEGISPASSLPLVEIAKIELALHDVESSRQAAARAASIGTQTAETRIVRLYEGSSEKESGTSGDWQSAMLAYSTGKYSEAISALKKVVETEPDNGTAWGVLGLSEFALKDNSNALLHLRRGQELGLKGSAESVQAANYTLGLLLIHDGRFERAAEDLARAGNKGFLANEVQFASGMALLRIASFPGEVDASKHSLLMAAGEIAEMLRSSDYDAAFPRFKALLKEYPSTPYLHYAYGTGLAALSQYDEAAAQMTAELAISPRSELPYLGLASIALKRHLPQDALTAAARAAQLAPESAEAHYLLGRANLELGREGAAINELEIAERLAPGSPEVHFNLARAYTKAKMTEKAERERADFVRLNAIAEAQRGTRGSQAYRGPQGPGETSVEQVR